MSTPPMNRCIFAKLIPTRKPPGRLLLIIKYMSSFINNLRNQYSRVWRKSLQSVLCPTTKPKPQVNSQKQLSTKSNNSDRQCNNTDTSTYPTVRKLYRFPAGLPENLKRLSVYWKFLNQEIRWSQVFPLISLNLFLCRD